MRRFIVASLCLALVAGAAGAADLKVPSTTYPTIQDAATAAQPGDRILVAKGYYNENVTLNQSDVQILGKKAVWDGTVATVQGTALTATGDNIVVSGFLFSTGSTQVSITGNGALVTKCSFHSPTSNGASITGNGAVFTKNSSFGANSDTVRITGDDAQVTKNRMTNQDGSAIEVVGADALVEKNSVLNGEDDQGIQVTGNGARVLKNKTVGTEGIADVDGDDCVVEGNFGAYMSDDGLNITGDNVTIRKNKVLFNADDSDGIVVTSATGTGGGVIEDNVVVDIIEDGFELSVSNVTIRRNSATRCGSEGDDGFTITGATNTIEDNKASDIDDDGFKITGDGNTLSRNTATRCMRDGFDVVSGDGNTIDACSATLCEAEGLDNSGTNTVVTNSKFTKCRIDVANDGTFTTFTGNTFSSGGDATAPEID